MKLKSVIEPTKASTNATVSNNNSNISIGFDEFSDRRVLRSAQERKRIYRGGST
jgi:hypothetical protein